MDTLIVHSDDKKPLGFQRKFLSLPSKHLLVAGTGSASLINRWFEHVSSWPDLKDVDHLNETAQSALLLLAHICKIDESTATLYHFGYSKNEERYVGYAHRSAKNFELEKLQYALGIKPSVYFEPQTDIKLPDFFIEVVLEQQRQDRLLSVEDQVGIGGEIEFAELANGATRIETVHRFDTYEHDRQ